MRKFQFSMETALNWRRRQLELEEAKVKQLTAELQQVESALNALIAERDAVEEQLREAHSIAGADLQGLAIYRSGFVARKDRLGEERQQCELRLARQRQKMVEARRKVKVIEKLRERKLDEWTQEYERELENLASEVYLAQWQREN